MIQLKQFMNSRKKNIQFTIEFKNEGNFYFYVFLLSTWIIYLLCYSMKNI